MGISGNLKTMVLPELLQWLSMGQKTGTLVIDNGKIEKKVFFEDGMIISSASTDPKEYLGRFLVSHGYLPDEEVDEALTRQKSENQLLGQILVNMGAIEEEDLQQMLGLKTEESLYDIFTWEEGDFEFFDNQLPEETMVRMALDVQALVLEGSRRLDEWVRIREWVPSPLCVPVAVTDLQALELEDRDLRILEWIDDDRSVDDISQGAQTSLFDVTDVIAAQVSAGTVKVVRPRTIEVVVEAPATESVPQPTVELLPPAAAEIPTVPSDPIALSSGRNLRFATPAEPAEPGVPAAQAGAAATASPAPPSAALSAENLLRQAEESLDGGDLESALQSFRSARDAPGSNAETGNAVRNGELKVQEALERDGIDLSTVPKLKSSMDQLTELEISPKEGFMLTRIDGSYDLKSILKMSPMPKIDAQMLCWRLKKLGHVTT